MLKVRRSKSRPRIRDPATQTVVDQVALQDLLQFGAGMLAQDQYVTTLGQQALEVRIASTAISEDHTAHELRKI